MTWRRRSHRRGGKAPRKGVSDLARARHVDPNAYRVFRSCSRKRRFETAAAALEAASQLADAAVLRAYPCKYCGGFHLTSRPRTS